MNGLQNRLAIVLKLFRLQEWVLTKYLFNMSLVMAFLLFNDLPPESLIEPALLYLLYMLPIGAFAYFLNDVTDLRYDRRIGKENLSENIKAPYKSLLLICLFLIACLPAMFIDGYVNYLILLVFQLAAFILYAIPGIRFKSHIGGLFCDAFFSYVFPGLIALQLTFQTGDMDFRLPLVLVAMWLFLTGFRSVLSHQINYLRDDKASGQITFVQSTGINPSLLIRQIVISLELLSFGLLLTVMSPDIQYGILAGFILCVGYEIIFQKNIDFKSFINSQNISLLNVYYNYFIFSGLCLVFVYYGYMIFLIPLVIFNFYRFYALVKSLYYNVFKWIYFKSKGLFQRIKKIM